MTLKFENVTDYENIIMWQGQSTIDDSYQRVKESDESRLEIEQKTGRVFPDIDQMRIGEAREFTLAVLHIDVNGYTKLMSRLTDSFQSLRFLTSDAGGFNDQKNSANPIGIMISTAATIEIA